MSWKSLIRSMPLTVDFYDMQDLWNGALEICTSIAVPRPLRTRLLYLPDTDMQTSCVVNSDDRDWKQALPKDLDNDEYCGRYHIRALMDKRVRPAQYDVLIETSRSFLVMTHTAMVDCLSVDTYVGSLYNSISGASGTRAIPFFQHICEIIAASHAEIVQTIRPERLDSTMIALVTSLSEILRRESRARYNEDLPNLINCSETAAQMTNNVGSRVASSIIISRAESFAPSWLALAAYSLKMLMMISKKRPSSALYSLYPRDIVIPGENHDNDKADITQISIFPTKAEIMSEGQEFLPSTDRDQPHFLTSKPERH